ncbi:IS110-like element ISRhru3 family transposase [Paralimibaculum aggregatum]|uniref:IS110-like element ISRhru3 family transposase n=1 Tax=Paralimibaculum aggregatum TaxID=3036245 RepID=A0ABQ6LTD9_9RHOB|nr:IS110 family transposase [Limibaculum sp. NKW23]GMG85355.1 IS110-like element ISRhru3 family transposase [Limibaculum sp. NKW23]
MGFSVGLDVSLESVSICIVDDAGCIVSEARVDGDPDAVLDALRLQADRISRIGLEAGPTSEWIAGRLLEAGLPVVCLETRHVKAALSAMTVKTDRNDARGLAQIVRSGWFKAVHLKSADGQRLRTLAAARKVMVRAVTANEQAIRGLLRPFGLKVGAVTRRRFGDRVRSLTGSDPLLATIVEPLLRAHDRLRLELAELHRLVLRAVRTDTVCGRLMTMPGIGPVTALTFRATVDDPTRFRRSRAVGAYLGLTPRRYQSGETDRVGRITKVGDGETRTALFEAANVILRPTTRWPAMKAWAMRIADRQGARRAKVALARRMAVILHRMWIDETDFRWSAA